MSDGSRLRQSWAAALSAAETQFRSLLVSSNSSSWKRVPLPAPTAQAKSNQTPSSNAKGKGRATSPDNVIIHRQQTKRGDVMRVVLDVPLENVTADLDKWRAVISTPEVRKDWDPAVEDSNLVEMFDWNTRITRTNYALGWPANPRDAVTISRIFHDANTLIDISTSLPRSPDEPAYLRPAPPYVRSHVHLFAWCIQIISRPSNEDSSTPSQPLSNGKMRITCFWQHDLKAVWALSSALSQQLPTMVQGLLRVVQKRGHRLPLLSAYGTGVVLERIVFEVGREALNVEYAIVHEEEDESAVHAVKALEEVNELKERKRLERSVECVLPDSIGWDVQISTRASSEAVASLPWKVTANRTSTTADSGHTTTFRIRHSSLPDIHSILKVKMVIELSGSASGLRLNGLPHPVMDTEPRDPTSFTLSRQLLQDTSSVSGLSFRSLSTAESNGDVSAASSTTHRRGISLRDGTIRSSAAEKSILTRVKRNYIYFSSLLQEPEAKWKRNYEARGVTITQLDSIDPTLVVYRAEAVFVGVGLWDLYSTIASPGARVNWDRGHEDAVLLDDVNELTELWHWRTKPNWPVNARDAVLLKTVYKSPTTVHVFSFSTDDIQLFPSIPQTDPNIIRTQVDLQGWAIEALSPTTTLLTLLEQSDPRGWANKSSIPQQMINAVAGVGEFAIKNGGPPINTRLGGARILSARYDHEKGSFKMEYEGCEQRRTGSGSIEVTYDSKRNSSVDLTKIDSPSPPPTPSGTTVAPAALPYIECELRCDLDTWASSLEVVIDPPPQTVTCLRRHRLSSGGGGLWLTIGHDAVFAGEERLLTIVRKGTSKERGAVVVNGAKIKVDVEDLPESEVKALTKMKRIKPVRVPLDQPPVLGVIRRRREEWRDEGNGNSNGADSDTNSGVMRWATSAPKFASPLSKFWTMAVEQTTATTSAAVSAATSVTLGTAAVADSPLSPSKSPIAYALSALNFLRDLHMNPSMDGWTIANDKGFTVHKKLCPQISPTIPVHKGEKVIEGISAEEVARIITNYDCRAIWDDRFDSATILQEFGAGCNTAFVISKGGFPFRDRGFYVANVIARLLNPSDSPAPLQLNDGASSHHPNSTAIFCASASFSPNSVESFDTTKYNPHGLPIGRIMIQGWILQTLDPYTTENYAIPSTRCTHVVSVDYAGSVPVAYNAMINTTLPRSILAVEQYMKGSSAIPVMRLPAGELAIVADDSKNAEEFNAEEEAWKLDIIDQARVLVSSRHQASNKKFRATIQISLTSNNVDVKTPRPSALTSFPLPEVSVNHENLSTPGTSPTTSPASTIRTRRISTTSTSLTTPRSESRDRFPAATSTSSVSVEFQSMDAIPTDLLLGELVVDSKLYPDGYEVQIASVIRDAKQPLQPLSLTPISPTSSDLPISCTCHVLPSTPLHSSGLSIDSPPRHLLRFTLPTARYETMSNDPLSLQPPVKPAWLTELGERNAIIEVVVFPAVEGGPRGKGVIVMDGTSIPVIGEKDSIRLLRRELEDERLGRVAKLSRIAPVPGSEALPKALTEPIAVALSLYDNSILVEQFTSLGAPSRPTEETESDMDTMAGDEGNMEGKESLRLPVIESQVANSSTSGFMKFFNGYPNALFRKGSKTLDISSNAFPTSLSASPSPSIQGSRTPSLSVNTETRDTRLYPLSVVLIIGLISFLFGSLLRSLLTPADFIYISQDLSELDDGRGGWRELKRLVEFKYAIGGWDFLIGVVRRH